jgi:hypothetical protein
VLDDKIVVVLALSNSTFAWLFAAALAWNLILFPILFVRARRRDDRTDSLRPERYPPELRCVGAARVRRRFGSGSASWPLAVLEIEGSALHLFGRGLARIASPSIWFERSSVLQVEMSRRLFGSSVVAFVLPGDDRPAARFYTTLRTAQAIAQRLRAEGWPVCD